MACGEAVGEWAVAWQLKSATTGYDVRWGSLDASGALLGGTETLTAVKRNQQGVALANDSGRSRYLAVWADYRHAGSGPDIYGQLLRDYTTVVEYTYDPLSRLVGAEYSSGVEFGYAYDEAGKRTHLTETTPLSGTIATTYTYDKASRLTARAVSDGRSYTYSWSQRGEMLAERTQGVDVRTFQWDAAGRLVEVSGPGGLEVTHTYDGANNRAEMTVNGAATAYVVDPLSPVDTVPQVLVETTGGVSTRNLYGLDLPGQSQGITTTYLGYDALSVRLHLDPNGAIAAQYRYGPFGEVSGQGRQALCSPRPRRAPWGPATRTKPLWG